MQKGPVFSAISISSSVRYLHPIKSRTSHSTFPSPASTLLVDGLNKIGSDYVTKLYAFLLGSRSSWSYRRRCLRRALSSQTLETAQYTRELQRGQHRFQTFQTFVPTFGTLLVGLVGSLHSPAAKCAVDVDGNSLAYCFLDLRTTRWEPAGRDTYPNLSFRSIVQFFFVTLHLISDIPIILFLHIFASIHTVETSAAFFCAAR